MYIACWTIFLCLFGELNVQARVQILEFSSQRVKNLYIWKSIVIEIKAYFIPRAIVLNMINGNPQKK